jgi:hypothetical protein
MERKMIVGICERVEGAPEPCIFLIDTQGMKDETKQLFETEESIVYDWGVCEKLANFKVDCPQTVEKLMFACVG